MAKLMQILGIGTDIIECDRIGQMIDRHGERFLERVYTPTELTYCRSHKAAVERLAGRWAAKEAILKALGTGWRHGIGWRDLEIRNEVSGKPCVALHGLARDEADREGVREIRISISHCRTHAVAYALAMGEAPDASQDPNDMDDSS